MRDTEIYCITKVLVEICWVELSEKQKQILYFNIWKFDSIYVVLSFVITDHIKKNTDNQKRCNNSEFLINFILFILFQK